MNASYNPLLNQITFPAGILQAPFFDPNADMAVNFGGIGAVIGHEIGHVVGSHARRNNTLGAFGNIVGFESSIHPGTGT